ncbi:hypothetical protein [Streptomyces kronopolitis]
MRATRREWLTKHVLSETAALNSHVWWDDPDYRAHLQRLLLAAEVLRDHLVRLGSHRIATPASLWGLLIELHVIRDDVAPECDEDVADVAVIFIERLNLLALDIDQRREVKRLSEEIRDSLSRQPWVSPAEPDSSQPHHPEDVKAAALAAEETVEHTLARLLLRLGPPPESTDVDYIPAGRGGGGAQQ